MAFASENMTMGQMNAVIKKLGGERGAIRFLRDELVLRERAPIQHINWKTVTLGQYATPDGYRDALKCADYRIGRSGDLFLNFIEVNKSSLEVELSLLSVRALGFEETATFEQVCMAAVARGFSLCPAEVGFALCLQYPEAPETGWLMIGMQPVRCEVNERNHIIRIGAHGDQSNTLTSENAEPDYQFVENDRFIFVRNR